MNETTQDPVQANPPEPTEPLLAVPEGFAPEYANYVSIQQISDEFIISLFQRTPNFDGKPKPAAFRGQFVLTANNAHELQHCLTESLNKYYANKGIDHQH